MPAPPPDAPTAPLRVWSCDPIMAEADILTELLDKLEKTCHLIHKENMVHKIS